MLALSEGRKYFLSFFFASVFCGTLYGQSGFESAQRFGKADSVAELCAGHSLDNLTLLAHKLTAPLPTEAEKFRAIYKWVCSNIDNDYALYLKIQRKRDKLKTHEELEAWNREFNPLVFRTLREKRRTVCTGYAYLIRELAMKAGITCMIVNGYGRAASANVGSDFKANHSWNAVMLDGHWYLCDPTWSSGTIDPNNGFVKHFEDAYFLADPELFGRTHYPLDTAWTLTTKKYNLKTFVEGPVVYRAAFKHKVNPVSPCSLNVQARKGEVITFRFSKTDKEVLPRTELLIKSPGSILVPAEPYLNEQGLYCIDHTFDVAADYTVHILLNGQHAITYVVAVE